MMTISLPGLIRNAVASLKEGDGDPTATWVMLEGLADHLAELRDRTERGDYTALDEFFALYTWPDGEYRRDPVKPSHQPPPASVCTPDGCTRDAPCIVCQDGFIP